MVLAASSYGALILYASSTFQALGYIGLPLSGGLLRGIGGIALGHCVFKFSMNLRKHRLAIECNLVSYGKYVLLLPLACVIYTGNLRYCWLAFALFVSFVIVSSLETKRDRILSSPFFVWLGKISFSVYLIHTVVILAISPTKCARTLGDFGAAFYAMILTIAASTLIHYAFEVPSRRYLRGLNYAGFNTKEASGF